MREKQAMPLDKRRIEECSFIVVDFETTTPKGHPPEPIELGAMRITTGLHIDILIKRGNTCKIQHPFQNNLIRYFLH
jgi:DNA polymerase III epsilon subunit-like protein